MNPFRSGYPASSLLMTGGIVMSAPGSVALTLADGRMFTMPREFGSFEFRLEAFNALNDPNLGPPSNTSCTLLNSTSRTAFHSFEALIRIEKGDTLS
jgi:hypothetical protein